MSISFLLIHINFAVCCAPLALIRQTSATQKHIYVHNLHRFPLRCRKNVCNLFHYISVFVYRVFGHKFFLWRFFFFFYSVRHIAYYICMYIYIIHSLLFHSFAYSFAICAFKWNCIYPLKIDAGLNNVAYICYIHICICYYYFAFSHSEILLFVKLCANKLLWYIQKYVIARRHHFYYWRLFMWKYIYEIYIFVSIYIWNE